MGRADRQALLTHKPIGDLFMASIIAGSIDVTKIPKEKLVQGKKGKYLNVSIMVEDDTKYGNNVGIIVGQTKEEREAKEPRTYLGNAKVIWTDGNITVAEKEEQVQDTTPQADDLYGEEPF